MAAKEEIDCGFSCTLAKKKVYQILNDLVYFSSYDPKTAREIADEMMQNMDIARRMVYANQRT